MKQIKPLVLNREKRCHICSSWTSLNGCAHYGPQDYDQNKPIIDAITKAVHGDNGNIVETSDFYAGVNAALLVLRQNNLIQAGQSAVQDATQKHDLPTNIPDGGGDWIINQETFTRGEVFKILFTQRAMITNDLKTSCWDELPETAKNIILNPRKPKI